MAIALVFSAFGLGISSWASRIPTFQERLGLNNAELGGVLLGLPAGLLCSLFLAGYLITSIGSKKVAVISSILFSAFLMVISISGSTLTLVVSLFALGFSGSLLNISINTQAVGLESVANKSLMSSFHGAWSLAGLFGAAVGTLMIARSTTPFVHYSLIAAVCLAVTAFSARYLLATDPQSDIPSPTVFVSDKTVLVFGLISFGSTMIEGSMYDWVGVYFKSVLTIGDRLIGLGYTIFMIAMTGTRFAGDFVVRRLGIKRTLQASGALAGLGLMITIALPQVVPASIGFFLIGAGISVVVPVVYSAVGKLKNVSTGPALASVTTMGFVGLLFGPPIIGAVAEVSSLRVSFLLLLAMAIAVTWLSTRAIGAASQGKEK